MRGHLIAGLSIHALAAAGALNRVEVIDRSPDEVVITADEPTPFVSTSEREIARREAAHAAPTRRSHRIAGPGAMRMAERVGSHMEAEAAKPFAPTAPSRQAKRAAVREAGRRVSAVERARGIQAQRVAA